MGSKRVLAALVIILAFAHNAPAAQGEMGTGMPIYGLQGTAGHSYVTVFRLDEATIPFPVGCTYLVISSFANGSDIFRAMVDSLLAAKLARKKIRFYAVQENQGGCGVDYLEVVD